MPEPKPEQVWHDANGGGCPGESCGANERRKDPGLQPPYPGRRNSDSLGATSQPMGRSTPQVAHVKGQRR
jgi:hypothetical protein